MIFIKQSALETVLYVPGTVNLITIFRIVNYKEGSIINLMSGR